MILVVLDGWPCTAEVSGILAPKIQTDTYQIVSLAIFGPSATMWFRTLQRINLKSVAATTAARVGCDQALFAPVQLSCFLSSMAIMEGKDPIGRWKTAFAPTYKANLMVWPFIQTANFAFVPLELRVLVVNVISLGMSFFLALRILKTY